jgi:hypothetical protein
MKVRVLEFVASSLFAFVCVAVACAAPDDWAEGAVGTDDGANRDFYNRRAALRWRNPEGDWRDADGVQQGPKPFATASIAGNQSEPAEFDVTGLVRDWVSGKSRNKGFLLRRTAGSARFHSREAEKTANRPQLVVVVNGKPQSLEAVADTHIVGSTVKAQGSNQRLSVSGIRPALIRFDLSGLQGAAKTATAIQTAALRLVPADSGSGEVAVFACDQGAEVTPVEPRFGIAARYPGDQGIEKDADVLFATGFESENWEDEWTSIRKYEGGANETVAAHPEAKFEPLDGKALRVRVRKGSTSALNGTYKFQKEHGYEPEEICFRYYLRFGDDWNQTVQGGKMPGISGTYGNAGWGGRRVNGQNGWSARGSFALTFPAGNPLAGKQRLGWYCYHADMKGFYGNQWAWSEGYRGYLDNNRWYCVEQYCKINTLAKDGEEGKRDGILRAWIDGRPAFEKTDIRFRDVDTLKIEQIWMNVFHGGTQKSPYDQHLYIDNVVVAKKYIGPMSGTEAE